MAEENNMPTMTDFETHEDAAALELLSTSAVEREDDLSRYKSTPNCT